MKKLIKMATAVASIGAMLGFAGCGAKAPDAVALDVLQTLQAGKITPEYLAKNCTTETAQFFSMFGAMAVEGLKGATFTVIGTKIDGDSAVVTIKQDGGNQPGVTEYDLVRVDGAWKLEVNKEKQAKRDVESKVEEKLVTGGKDASAAEAAVVACINFAKKGLLNKESAPKFFSCAGDDLDQVLPIFDLFNYKSNPDYKSLPKEEQEKADKEAARLGVTSSSFSTVGGYAVVGIGDKATPDKEFSKFKVVKDNGKWKIAGIYLEAAEMQKRIDSLTE